MIPKIIKSKLDLLLMKFISCHRQRMKKGSESKFGSVISKH